MDMDSEERQELHDEGVVETPVCIPRGEHELRLQDPIREAVVSESHFRLAATCVRKRVALQVIETLPLDIVTS